MNIRRRWFRFAAALSLAAFAGCAALHAWAKGLSRDLARDGITVNCVPPGRFEAEPPGERLHPDPAELSGDVVGGEALAARAGLTAFEALRGQGFHVRACPLRQRRRSSCQDEGDDRQ